MSGSLLEKRHGGPCPPYTLQIRSMAGTEARPTGKDLVGRPSLAATLLLAPPIGLTKANFPSRGASHAPRMARETHPNIS